MSQGRNERCSCGSGKKHKHCCLQPVENLRLPVDGSKKLSRSEKDEVAQLLVAKAAQIGLFVPVVEPSILVRLSDGNS